MSGLSLSAKHWPGMHEALHWKKEKEKEQSSLSHLKDKN